MSKVHFVGGEKGGVGKSVIARLLCQYCIDKKLAFTALLLALYRLGSHIPVPGVDIKAV